MKYKWPCSFVFNDLIWIISVLSKSNPSDCKLSISIDTLLIVWNSTVLVISNSITIILSCTIFLYFVKYSADGSSVNLLKGVNILGGPYTFGNIVFE